MWWKTLYYIGQIDLSSLEKKNMPIPEEIKEAISALDNNIRWRIVEMLQKREESAYTELLGVLNVPKGSLTHHLNKLMESGIIDNFSKEEFGGPFSSYYRLSSFGNDMINGILSSIQILPIINIERHGVELEPPRFETYDVDKYLDSSELEKGSAKCIHQRLDPVWVQDRRRETYSHPSPENRRIRIDRIAFVGR
jgi:DNA-binding transcriptional ArsR family regulator